MISIDELRKRATYVHYLGLGVIKCRIGKYESYHFYSDRSPVLVNQIHDHRFGFTSTILKGVLKNTIYIIDGQDPESVLQVERGECKKEADREILVTNANMKELTNFTSCAGESYYIAYDTLHQIEVVTPALVTHLKKEPFSQIAPRFVVDTSVPHICAMSQPKTRNECWEIIEYTLAL